MTRRASYAALCDAEDGIDEALFDALMSEPIRPPSVAAAPVLVGPARVPDAEGEVAYAIAYRRAVERAERAELATVRPGSHLAAVVARAARVGVSRRSLREAAEAMRGES